MIQLIEEKALTPVMVIQNYITAAAIKIDEEKETDWPFPFCLEEPTPFPSERERICIY